MKTVGAFEAKTHFSQLLDSVEQGEVISVTRHGKEVARLIPAPETGRLSAEDAIERLRNFRRVKLPPGVRVKDLIQEGRRQR
jgi:prevent-host-death family protein